MLPNSSVELQSAGEVASFPCLEDVTGKRAAQALANAGGPRPFVATHHVGGGEGSIVYIVPPSEIAFDNADETPWSEMDQIEREVANEKRAVARARKALRLYIVSNHLTRMWTLTYARPHCDRAAVVADVNDWLQRLRDELGERFPAAYVLERHADGERFHVHVAMQSRFIKWERMAALWGHGHVQYSDGNKAVRRAKGGRAKSRTLARYLCKYLSKTWLESHEKGLHRYEVTQGFQPGIVRRVFRSHALAVAWLLEMNEGHGPEEVAQSSDWEDWFGPPLWLMIWR